MTITSCRYSIHELKFAILGCFSKCGGEEKFNLLGGRGGCPGSLEGFLRIEFISEERELAVRAFDELYSSGHVRVNPSNVVNTGNWFEISDLGKESLRTGALDEIDYSLDHIDPDLKKLRYGARETLKSRSIDSIRQAAHSMRELINQTLRRVAPDDEVVSQNWYQKPQGSPRPVTREQKIRYILQKRGVVSKSERKVIAALSELIERLHNKFAAESHIGVDQAHSDLNDLITETEIVLKRILS